jgi:hypothetical protein
MAKFNRVAGSAYRFEPVMIDRLNVRQGDVVRVVNLHGCPTANTMGQAHFMHLDGAFGGLVCTNSLRCKGSR